MAANSIAVVSFVPMKKLKYALLLAGVMAGLSFNAKAQGQGNFDPEQMRERMMERVREQLEITKDDEWMIVKERAEKVMTLRRETSFGGGMFRGGGPGGRRDGGNGGGGNG